LHCVSEDLEKEDPGKGRGKRPFVFMNRHIDALYGGFVTSLPAVLRPLASELPYTLGLAPAPGVSWSQVFSHEVTLEAPALIAEAFPKASGELVRRAILGHALSVIEAFTTDRLKDSQVRSTPELLELLEHIRSARDSVIEQVLPGSARVIRAADRQTQQAIGEERELLSSLGAASFDDYKRISSAKQAVGLPASVAFARAVGATESQVEEVRRALSGIWLGLQFEDDAVDWEDDWRRGHGAWAVSLARRRLEAVKEQRSEERPTEPDLIRRRVFNMRVLYLMLRSARHQYRSAWRYARAGRLQRLGEWCEQRIVRLDKLLPLEERHAGYVVRARKLAPWAAEVLS
jgi:hypothetical protein